jgi:adenosine deaminase
MVRTGGAGRTFFLLAGCVLLCSSVRLTGQAAASSEARTARTFEEARKEGPLALRAFLYRMPKGADLHSHLGGAVYAETFIREAGEDGICVNAARLKMDEEHHGPNCPEG